MSKRKRSLNTDDPLTPNKDEAATPEVMPENRRRPVRADAGQQPTLQAEGAPNEPIDHTNGRRGRQQPTESGDPGAGFAPRNQSPTRGWKDSRDFFERTSGRDPSPDKSNISKVEQDKKDKTRYQDSPPRRTSPAGKLKSSARSTSYAKPLAFPTEDNSKPKSAPAPLTERNLRSLARSLYTEQKAATATSDQSGKKQKTSEVVSGPDKVRRAPATRVTDSVSVSAAGAVGKNSSGAAFAPPAPPTSQFAASSMPKSKSPSKSPKKHDKDKEKKKSQKYDANTHPLNLPPDQLRQHLAHMARQEAESAGRMSLDRDMPETANGDASIPNGSSQPATPSKEAPGAFPGTGDDDDEGTTNGVTGHDEERSPTPPPHKTPPPPNVDPEACKAAGNKFFKAKDYDRAVQEYTKAVEAEPTNPTYLSNRAAAYISANKYNQALSDCVQANRLDPGNDKILHRLARVYTSLGRPQDALDTYGKIPNASATDTSSARRALQAIEMAEKQIDAEDGDGKMALWSIGEAMKTLGAGTPTPRRWAILKAKANLKVGSANALGEVTGIAQSLMRENSQDATAIVLAGRALYLRDEKPRAGKSDYERAEDHFRQALNLDPDNTDARNSLRTMKKLDRARTAANDLFKRGRYSEAVQSYTECLPIDPSNKVTNAKLLGNRAMARMKIKEFDEAKSDCDQALKLDPTYMKARRTRAKATGESGDWEQAVKDLKALAEDNPGDAELAKELRNAELELKKSKRKDWYKILGVDKDADPRLIERAYKKKATQLHPDKTQGDKEKEAQFKDCLEAKEILLDPQKRAMFDSGADLEEPGMGFPGGMGGFPGGMGGFPGGGMGGFGGGGGGVQIDPEMLFNMMGGMGGAGGQGGGGFRFSSGGGRSPFG